VFDVLYLDGRSLLELPWDERRRRLEELALAGPTWAVPPAFTDVPGSDVLRASADQGLEGVVAKRRDSRYQPGRRSPAWIKVKHALTQEVVVGGWTGGQGRRRDGLGALLLGLPGDGGLTYVGKVGTGFSDQALEDLLAALSARRQDRSPFVGRLPASQVAGATWVRPELVGEVRFSGWTAERRLRHPAWRGLRPDKVPADVVPEA
jgi:bifunctional non-homologous end joining protein LigD